MHRSSLLRSRYITVSDSLSSAEGGRVLLLTVSTLWGNLGGLFVLYLANGLLVVPLILVGLLLGLVPTIALGGLVIYPALVAIMGAAASLMRDQPHSLFTAYRATLASTGRTTTLIGVLFNTYLYAYAVGFAQLRNAPAPHLGLLLTWVGQTLFLALLVVTLVYAFPLIALFHLEARTAIRNGLLLAISNPLPTAGMIGTLVLLSATIMVFGIGMLLIVPLAISVLLVANCYILVQRTLESESQKLDAERDEAAITQIRAKSGITQRQGHGDYHR